MTDSELLERFHAGDRRALARLITLLDNDPDRHRLLDELAPGGCPPARRAGIIGVTGAPGVGKSTLLGRLISGFRARGHRVAVLAVDPQSPISGGALLGDRIRMADAAAGDEDVFIRSLSSRGVAGGLSASVRWICRLLERFGYDLILVETVGVGQAELGVLRVADVVVLVVMPGTGDGVQWEKAGLIEVAHLVVINKADHPGVDRIEQELREALEPMAGAGNGDPSAKAAKAARAAGAARLAGGAQPERATESGSGPSTPANDDGVSQWQWQSPSPSPSKSPPPSILRTIASEGVGIDAVDEQLEKLLAACAARAAAARASSAGSEGSPSVDWRQARTEILQEAEMLLSGRLQELGENDPELVKLGHAVAQGQLDISAAAEQVLVRLLPLAARMGRKE